MSALSDSLYRFEPPWIEVGRIFRRICFLRSEGLGTEAQLIEETEFADATAKARKAVEPESEAESILKTLLQEEAARVSEAIAFAEVLVPLLAKRLSLLAPQPRAQPVQALARRDKAPVHDEDRGIADFIDDMLAQERTGTR